MATTKEIQNALMKAGYNIGTSGADGIMGRDTINALTKFQLNSKLNIQYPGTVGPITLKALGLTEMIEVLPPWIVEGQRKLGLHETLNNAELKKYLKSDGQTLGDPAVLPWCGDFIETIISLTLPKEPMVTNPYWAANWLKFGVAVPKDRFYMGAIGVKSRTGGNHVFTLVGHDKTYVHAMGGNQSNSISIVKIAKSDITGMRFPSTYPYPKTEMRMTVFNGKINASEA